MRILASVVGIAALSAVGAQRARPHEPLPRPAVPSIVHAFDDHRLVAIGEMHRNQQVHDVIVHVLEDRAFLPDGGDIVVEWGNARYQNVIERFVAGGSVAHDELTRVWRDAVNILVWDAPVYERVFDTIRSINRQRSPEHRLRVILADPPFDWSTIQDRASWERIAATRDRFAADAIEREVLARGRRALLIFGSAHVQNDDVFDRDGTSGRARSPNLARLLQTAHPGYMFTILADWMKPQLDRRLAGWRPPVVARLEGNWLGDVSVGPAGTPQLKELADAFLFLGSTASLTLSTPPPEIYRDPAYMRELIRRDAIQGGANSAELKRLQAINREK